MPLSPKPLPTKIYQLNVNLLGLHPHRVFRQLHVPSDITFHTLHQVIQVVMGWSATSDYRFDFKNIVLARSDPTWGLSRVRNHLLFVRNPGVVLKARRSSAKLRELISRRRVFTYMYDWVEPNQLGWEYRIAVEKTLPMRPETQDPVCIAGGGASPPEDCGHDWGFRRLLELKMMPNSQEAETKTHSYISGFKNGLFRKTRQEEVYVNLMRWLGKFNPGTFDLEETNRALSDFSQMGFRYFQYLEIDSFPPRPPYDEES